MRLRVEGLTKIYGKKNALDSVSLTASNGIYGLLGPNGAGKTTLMRIIAGLVVPQNGTVVFDGENILKNMDSFRYKLGYLPQEFGSFKRISVYHNLIKLRKTFDKKSCNQDYGIFFIIMIHNLSYVYVKIKIT